MSLIDDALKRAQEAAEKAGPARERPWVPAPLPDPAIARRRRLVRALALALAAAAALAAVVWGIRFALQPVETAPARGKPSNAPAALAVAPTPEPTLKAVEVPPPAEAMTRRPTSLPQRTPLVDTEGLNEGAETKVPAPAPERGGKVHSGSVTLPGGARIELGGIVWSETEPRALVNDRIVGVGGYVEGYTITKIEEDRITLEKDGATLILTVK